MVVLVSGAIYLGWRYASWEPAVPEPRKQTTTIKIPVSGKPEALPVSTAATEISQGRFEITLPIPSTLPRQKPPLTESPLTGEEPARAVAQSSPTMETTPPISSQTGPSGVAEQDLAQVSPPEPGREEPPECERPFEELEKPLRVGDLTIPPPQAVPPFKRGEKAVFILETVRQGRTIAVRGTTNLPVEGNGVQVSLFRLFREGESREAKRASLDSRNLSLWFEGKFPVDDGQWLRSRRENEKAQPLIFPAMSYLDEESVQVEVLFTGAKKDLGPVPGLTVYPIPGTDKQVYRIIRSVNLPVPESPRETPPLKKVEKEEPPAVQPLHRPGGPTRIRISPLKWLEGPLQTRNISSPGEAPLAWGRSMDRARLPEKVAALGRVLTYRF